MPSLYTETFVIVYRDIPWSHYGIPASPSTDTIRAQDLVIALRCALGLPPLERPPTDDLPGHVLPGLEVEGVNHRWLIAWAIAGLPLFANGEMPTMAAAIIAAKRTLATLAMDAQCGSITSAARLLRTGQRNVRRTLEEAACYPWRDLMDRHPPIDPVSWCRYAGGSDDDDEAA